MRVRLPRLISQAISHENWKFRRRSSMLQLLSVATSRPSSVSATRSSSVPAAPGSSETLTMRMMGARFQPSARMVPVDGRPSAAAVSRLER